MNNGIKIRKQVYNILYDIYNLNENYDNLLIKYKIYKLNKRDIAFVNNVCLNTMRYYFHTQKILKKYIIKKPKTRERILFCSAITQIVFLNFKDYGVINSTVEISKSLNMYPGFFNATLKQISKNKKNLKNTLIDYEDLPDWFIQKTKDLSELEKNEFLKNFYVEPDLHLVFKNNKSLLEFEEELTLTSKVSGFLKTKIKVEEIDSYYDGNWWVQGLSSSFPLNNVSEDLICKSCFDMCAAPGGKSFQVLSKNKNIVLNDKSKKRIKILNNNLKRLRFRPDVLNIDITRDQHKNKYDFIIIDAPCSSVGTIRKNPDILFKKNQSNFNILLKTQSLMLEKAASILMNNGTILYMVCSFLKLETVDQIEKFIKKYKNFHIDEFSLKDENLHYKSLLKNKYMLTVPTKIKGFNVDGYFAILLKKTKNEIPK